MFWFRLFGTAGVAIVLTVFCIWSRLVGMGRCDRAGSVVCSSSGGASSAVGVSKAGNLGELASVACVH